MESSGRISREDVRSALESAGGDPFGTNAARLREVLGRGSLSTIQKHLQALREERQPSAPAPEEGVPEVPEGLAQSLWAAAWAEASKRHSAELLKALGKVNELRERLEVALQDIDALTEEMDRLREEAESATKMAKESQGQLETERAAMAGEREALNRLMAQVQAMLPPGAKISA